jgi:hypothetical protein
MEQIKELVLTLPKENKFEVFYDFYPNLKLNWSEMQEVVEYIRKTKQVQVTIIQKMPMKTQLRLACYLYYDEVNLIK